MNNLNGLLQQITRIVGSTPAEWIMAVLPFLYQWDNEHWSSSRSQALKCFTNPQVIVDFQKLFDLWQRDCSDLPGSALALALQSHLPDYAKEKPERIELVWTGPDTQIIPLRRTDQTLIQLIDSARSKLLVVSFAVYKIQTITDALLRAIRRNVRIQLVIEDPEESLGKIGFSGIQCLGNNILAQCEVYSWPYERRPKNEDGKHGSLHAKLALADDNALFISSANLTEYAMELNMEMGVLINGGETPKAVGRHFEELIMKRIIERVK